MKRSIKRIISFALVMTMLLSTMITVSAEGTIAAEDVSFEEELMPMSADPCASNNAAGFTGKPYVYFYNGVSEINLRYNVRNLKTGTPSYNSDCYVECVDEMAEIADNYIHRDDDETDDSVNNEICKAIWYELREDTVWDDYRVNGYDYFYDLVEKLEDDILTVCLNLGYTGVTAGEIEEMAYIFANWVSNENFAYECFYDFPPVGVQYDS